jgi:hypothetical protein
VALASRYLGHVRGTADEGEEPWTEIKLWCPEIIRGAARRRRIPWRSPPPGVAGGFIRPATLARGGQALRRGQRQCPPNRRQRQSGLHRPPLCFSAMLAREFSVMVGLMSGKAKSAIPQNSVGSRSRGWVERLVCGSCHQLGNHSWWWGPPDSNRRPPACKASSARAVTCGGNDGCRLRQPWHCPWVSAGDRSGLL